MSDVYEIIEKLSREVCELHADNQRLRARVAVLERVRAAADDFFAYERSWYWGEKFKALLAALKEATP
jgi:DNA-binding GntR family transcriptional regulator